MARKPRNVGTVEVAIVRYGMSLGDGPVVQEYTAEVRNVAHGYGVEPEDCIGDTVEAVMEQLALSLSQDVMASGHGPLTGTFRIVEDHCADDHAIAIAERAMAQDYIDVTQPAYEPATFHSPAWTAADEYHWQEQEAEIAAERVSESAFAAMAWSNDLEASC